MSSKWSSVLAGLGRGAQSLGNTIEERKAAEKAAVRQAALDALAKRVAESNIRYTDARALAESNPTAKPTAIERQYIDKRGGFVSSDGTFTPVQGLPELPPEAPSAPTDLASRLQKRVAELVASGRSLREAAEQARLEFGQTNPADPLPSIVQGVSEPGAPPQIFRVDRESGPARPVEGIAPKPELARGGAAMQQAVASNRALLRTINEAIADLEKNPNAVGLKRGLSDKLNQFVDPAGVGTRAKVANLGSQKMHDRSGAAVAIHEMPRLAPFIPAIDDQSTAAITKLREMARVVENETQEIEKVAGSGGGGGRGGGNPSQRPAPPSGNITLPGKPPLSEADRQRAATNPAFAGWLRARGYEVP